MADQASVSRLSDITHFYDLLQHLAERQREPAFLPEVIPSLRRELGVYFFFEPGEDRSDSGRGPRVVRIGTHALKVGATSTLRGRLRQHGGTNGGTGNHRGSIFRLLTGDALVRAKIERACLSWASKPANKDAERALEQAVSRRLATTRVVWVGIDDAPSPDSLRGRIERNAIAMLSNHGKAVLDPPSQDWLGLHSSRVRVRSSGLWNQNHVDEAYDPSFLVDLERSISRQ